VNLTRPKTNLFSKNPSIENIFFNEHVPGHVQDLVKNHHWLAGLGLSQERVENLVTIYDIFALQGNTAVQGRWAQIFS
jgi:hypothetical protein